MREHWCRVGAIHRRAALHERIEEHRIRVVLHQAELAAHAFHGVLVHRAGLQQLVGRRQQQLLPERDHGLATRRFAVVQVDGLDLGMHVAEAAGQQQVAQLGADERVAAVVVLEVVEGHPVAPDVRRVRVEQERGIHHFGDVDRRTRCQHAAHFAQHAGRGGDVFQHPAQERRIEAAGLERQFAGIGLLQGVAVAAPRRARQVLARRGQLRFAQVHAGHVQLGEAAQQDLGLRTDAAADFQQAPCTAVVDLAEDARFQQARLGHQALLFGAGKPVQVGRRGDRRGHGGGLWEFNSVEQARRCDAAVRSGR